MTRKLIVTAFLLALCWIPKTAPTQAGASCSAHVCTLCAESGLACVALPHCHCE